MLWLDLKTYKTLPKAAKYYGQERRNGLLYFQSNPEIHHNFIGFCYICIFSKNRKMVTRPRDRFTASPHSMISAWTSPATCAIHNTAKRLPNNLVNYLPRTLVFSFAFLRDKKLRLIIIIYSISGRNWNQSTMENGLLYTISPIHEKAIWNIITI